MKKAAYFSLIVRVEGDSPGPTDFVGEITETLSGKRWIIRPSGSATPYVVFIERAEEIDDPHAQMDSSAVLAPRNS